VVKVISTNLLIWCLAVGAGYLLLVSAGLDFAEKKLRVTQGIPSVMLESGGVTFFVMNFIMEALFYVVIPSIVYGFFYTILPLTSVRAGLAAALFAFVLGAAPLGVRLSVRLKLPTQFVLFLLVSHLLKLGGALAIIAYLYSL
jgi:hypothetical protein